MEQQRHGPVVRLQPEPGRLPSLLIDPLNDRQVEAVPLPAARLLSGDVFWDERGEPRLDVLDSHLHAEGLLTQELILELISRVKEQLELEPNLIMVNDPVTVVGDIHGQFFDLRTLLDVGGSFDDTQYLFLGDYVDRGSFSMEVVTYLYAVKLKHPKRVHLLRGNHESRQMTSYFNFREECEFKYDSWVYEALMESFDALPIAALINKQFLAVHGGLSPDMTDYLVIQRLDRFQEPPKEGLLCDILWSDPMDDCRGRDEYSPNTVRGCAWSFSLSVANKFLADNNLLTIFRAHEVQKDGYKFHKTNPRTSMPSVITIFSAPNYCDAYGNRGAVLKLENNTLNLKQFNFTEHPYHLANFMSVFEWSLPFVAEQTLAVFEAILGQPADYENGNGEAAATNDVAAAEAAISATRAKRPSLTLDENRAVEFALELSKGLIPLSSDDKTPKEEAASKGRILQKVRAIARMAAVYKRTVEKHQKLICLKGVCPGDKLSPDLLLEARGRISSEDELFDVAQNLDTNNEKRPLGAEALPKQSAAAGEPVR